jgi:hypothetical protein
MYLLCAIQSSVRHCEFANNPEVIGLSTIPDYFGLVSVNIFVHFAVKIKTTFNRKEHKVSPQRAQKLTGLKNYLFLSVIG